ncbi:MAG TPA: hypothetical protein VHW67_13565 [Solirubrobacteraceae bacterium]|jgi:hypothetical protein|nr:hypothetical protein [Solirubrobacteraceae bacterium]
MRIASALALATSLLVCLAATASADTGTKIIERCTHGKSLSGFSQKDYRRALQELPTEVEEYSDCGNLIRRAQLAAAGAGGGSGSGGGGGGTTATPLSASEQSALTSAPKTGSEPLSVGDQLVHPGVVHADIASAFSSLPDPLLAVLAFLLACAAALGGRAIRDGIRGHRSH